MQRQLLVVLKRETLRLMDQSFKEKLSQESSKILINYLKLLKDLREPKAAEPTEPKVEETDDSDELSDEELKAIAQKAKHGDQNV